MADKPKGKGAGKSATLRIAEEAKRRPLAAAAIVGGAAAATAGAVMGARALARRNGGGPLNEVMETAITACEAAAACKQADAEATEAGTKKDGD
jgi:gamma-glutamyltranspeptidase